MGKLNVFNFTTLNGFFQGKGGDVGWAHEKGDPDFAGDMLALGSTLLFGRVTYEQMIQFWPTPMAMERMPKAAKGMNAAEKVVFSRTLKATDWANARVSSDLTGEVSRLKQAGKNLTVLGSGSIVTQLAQAGLIDELSIMLHPLALGAGTPMFAGLDGRLSLKLLDSKALAVGTVFLRYQVEAAPPKK